MKSRQVLKLFIVATLLSSCGYFEKFKTPEQPTDSKEAQAANESKADDLFGESMNDQSQELKTVADDKPSNIDIAASDEELKKLDEEFSANGPKETQIIEQKESPTKKEEKVIVEEEKPIIEKEVIAITNRPRAGKMMTYKVKKGETLMQIAFKIYGDVGMWKDLKAMNKDALSKNSALKTNMELKYAQPEKDFVWNPEGTAYLVKNGDTLGVISNNVYQTPKKWKKIWENNKPLIKNPNVIFAGFTLYYKQDKMANYVQPAEEQKSLPVVDSKIEEVKVEKALSEIDAETASEVDLTKEIQSSTVRDIKEEIISDEQLDQSLPN